MKRPDRLGKDKTKMKNPASDSATRKKVANRVAEYSRGNVHLQFGRYSTAADKAERKRKIAELEL